ncbi:Cytochrome P450 89A2-like protein [Drosera capensis]
MEAWFLILATICLSVSFKSLLDILCFRSQIKDEKELPAGVSGITILNPSCSIGRAIPTVLVSSRVLAHQALIQKSAIFANRPEPTYTAKVISKQFNISSSNYGSLWRSLRRNITLDESQMTEMEELIRRFFTINSRFLVLDKWPRLTMILMKGRWKELYAIKKEFEDVILPHVRARKQLKLSKAGKEDYNSSSLPSYVDILLEAEVEDDNKGKRKILDEEMTNVCSEFLTAGSDTTATALQWIMANLVKNPAIQRKLFEEVVTVTGAGAEEVTDDDLAKMPYLKAVVLEGLRRHPPLHFGLPHAVAEEAELGGYKLPKKAIVNFMVAEMGKDPKVWDESMKFKPERFLDDETFDITGTREIKMMPFGAGRRICPGYLLGLLELQYFVANLVLKFEWNAPDGDTIDLTEKQEFTAVMKQPLRTRLMPRTTKASGNLGDDN